MSTNYWFPRILTKEDERDTVKNWSIPRFKSGDIGVVETENSTLLQSTLSKMSKRALPCSASPVKLLRGKPQLITTLD